jgi:hypothetical protein
MFENGHDAMRQTQNGFGNKWKPGDAQVAHGNLQPGDDDSEENVEDEDEDDDEALEE